MSRPAVLLENQTTAQDAQGIDTEVAIRCPLPVRPQPLDSVTSELCPRLAQESETNRLFRP
jgi:hypothetical protein